MADDEVVEDEFDDVIEEDGDPFAPEESESGGHGPGFIRGVIIGLIAGAGMGALLGGDAGKQLRDRIGEQTTPVRGYGEGGAPDAADTVADEAPVDGLRALVASLRERIREARRQASIASREAEELTHARYAELTRLSGQSDP